MNWILFSLVGVLGVTAGCHRADPAGSAPPPVNVRWAAAQSAAGPGSFPEAEYIALLRGETETELGFKVAGLLDSIGRTNSSQDWQEGAVIRKGEELARLKQADFVAAEQAARARRDLAASSFKRVSELNSKGAASPQELDVARAEMDSTAAAWAQADQALKDSTILSPYDGVILARLSNPGETIRPGVAVLRITSLDRISADIGVPEKLVGSIRVGSEIPLRVPALEGRAFTGRITEVGAGAKTGARLFRVVIQVENPGGLLKSGMTASVVLNPARAFPEGAVLVPLSALVTASSDPAARALAVFVVDDSGHARERRVKTDEIIRSSILVTEGLKPGERVVVTGASLLYDGAPVRMPEALP
ncbi:MAG: efflux RND transporter periplasmic adaptor subunit [Verrucomicrobiota bacterium]